MTAKYNRQALFVGNKVKVSQLRTGVDARNIPYWKFYVPFTMVVNGKSVVYKHLWCRVDGKPLYKENEWVEITKILGYHSNYRRNTDGGMSFFEDLMVEVKKVVLEDKYGANTNE